ncbi:MAG: NAD-binding protein, partial [Mucinivorans sp.]
MKIVIAGAGEVGSHLAQMLSAEYHDITVIDEQSKRLDELAGSADILPIEGDITSFETLAKGNVAGCDLFIAVSPEENTNILAATIAKQLGAKKAIARIDNDEYLQPNNKEVFINMGIDYMFYPEKVAAAEVVTLLGHTSTTEYIDFSGGRLAVVGFKLDAHSPLIGKTLVEVTRDRDALEYRTIAISRAGETIIPRGNDFFKPGDMIYVISNRKSTPEVMGFTGKANIDVRNMMILGGSRIGTRIAKELQNEINVKLVDYNPEKA